MAFIIYLLGVVDSIRAAIGLFVILSGIFALGTAIFMAVEHEFSDEEERIRNLNRAKYTLKIFIPLVLLAGLTPSSKTIAAMYLLPRMLENQQVQAVPEKVLTILNGKLNQWINDMSKEEK